MEPLFFYDYFVPLIRLTRLFIAVSIDDSFASYHDA